MASADIFRQYLQQPRSVVDYANDYASLDNTRLNQQQLRNQNALSALTLQKTAGDISDQTAQRNALRQIYSSLPANADPLARARAMQSNPYTAEKGIGAEKQVIENQKMQADIGKSNAEAEYKHAEYLAQASQRHAQALTYISDPQHIVGWIDSGIAQGIFPHEARDQMIAKAQAAGSVEAFKQQATEASIPALDRFKQNADMARAKLQSDTQMRGQDIAARGQDISSATLSRGQDLKAETARMRPAASGLHYDANSGNIIDLNSGQAKPVTAPDGTPIGARLANKPLTDSQSKALGFGSRMQEANKTLAELSAAGTTASVPGADTGGGVSIVRNMLVSENQQKLDQAQRDFVNSVLRRESGAAINESEFVNARKQYFPQIGDSKAVIQQKLNNREIAMRGVLSEVPSAQRDELVSQVRGKSAGTSASAKVMSMADVQATARASGKTPEQVIQAAKSKGYVVK